MNGRFLLDTNIIIALFAGEHAILKRLADTESVFVSSIVVGELYYGAQKSNRIAENSARIEEFVANSVVLPCDADTSRWYGQVKAHLHAKGRPIPENDIWVAATAFQYDLSVITRDHHFHEVEALSVVAW